MTNDTWTEVPVHALDGVAGGMAKMQLPHLQGWIKEPHLHAEHMRVAEEAIKRGIEIGETAMKKAVTSVLDQPNSWQGHVPQADR